MAALISSVMNTKDKVPFYVAGLRARWGSRCSRPTSTCRALDFAVVEGKIRFGLNAVKNVGETAARAIVAARDEGGPFALAVGLLRASRPAGGRTSERSRASSSAGRSTRPAPRGRGCSRCSSRRSPRAAAIMPTGWPGRGRSSTSASRASPRLPRRVHHPPIPAEEFEKPELLALEKETLGLYVSEHPLHGNQGPAAAQGRPADRRGRTAGGTATSSRSAASSARSAASRRARAIQWRSSASTTSPARSR